MPFVSPVPDRVAQKRISREVTADRLVIRQRWGTVWTGGLLFLGAVVLGFIAVRGEVPWDPDIPVSERLMQGVVLLIAVVLAYGGVAVMFNTTELEVTRELLHVATGPVPWGRAVRLDSAGIREVSYREDVRPGYATRYDVVAVTGEGEFILVRGLDNYEVLVFYVREIREFLRLPNRSMASLI